MSDQISVSEDKLDAKLARLELSLVDRMGGLLGTKADQKDHDEQTKRIEALEGRLGKLERFRYAVPSAAVISAVIAAGVLLVYLWR